MTNGTQKLMENKQMIIKEIKNEYGATVYHVEDMGIIQEFWTKKQAQDYIDYFNGE